MGILAGKNVLVTGVLTDSSIAFHIARVAQEEGATVVLTSFGRAMSITKRISARLPQEAPVLELDVTNDEHLANLAAAVKEHIPHLDGVVHSIGFAPEAALGGNFLNTEWPDVATAVHVSAYSLKSLTMACKPLFTAPTGASVVGLDFDAQVAWPKYDWMGVAKAALESTSRYLARDLGKENIRFNSNDVIGNPKAEVLVQTSSDGRIIVRKLVKSSGNKAWDEAVLRTFDKIDKLPLDTNGTIPSMIPFYLGPKD